MNDNERPTPLTDYESYEPWKNYDDLCVSSEFARGLERQLAEANEQLKCKQQRIESLQALCRRFTERLQDHGLLSQKRTAGGKR